MTAKKPAEKTIKSFFKFIQLDLVDKVKAELERGMDPNITFDAYGYGSTTALAHALAGGHDACARALMDAGADVKAVGSKGETALHAVRDATWAKELIEKGADLNATNSWQATPLHTAVSHKNIEIVELLLQAGAAVDPKNHEGHTPYATSHDYAIRMLLKKHGARGFDKSEGRVITPKKPLANVSEISIDRGAIGVDHRGRVWFGGYSGLFILDGDALTRYVFEESFAYGDIQPGPPGLMYIATNWGLVRVKDDIFTLFTSDNSELFDHHITYMRTSPDGRPHILSYESEVEEKHVSIFDGETFSVLSPGEDYPSGLELKCIAFDEQGDLVLGAEGAVAVRKNGTWDVIKDFGENVFAPHIYDIVIDQGTMWIGTQSGVYERRDGTLALHKVGHLAKHLVKDGPVLWVGTYYGGVARLENGALTIFDPKNSALPHEDINGLVRAPDGRIWVHSSMPCFIRNGVIERITGAPTVEEEKQAEEKAVQKERKRKLVPFPKKALYAKVPKNVRELLEKKKLETITVEQLLKVIRPAIAFDVEKQKKIPIGASKFGGQPDMPESLKWPSYRGERDRMMPFLMQINLADVTKMDKEGLLPKKGMLYFFSDTSPDELDQHRVLYTDSKKLVRREFPEDLVDRKDEDDFVAQVPEFKMKFFEIFTLPSVELLRRRAHLSDEDESVLYDLRHKLVKLGSKSLPGECSRVLGWPDSIQEEITQTEKEIVLLQLNGYELSPKGASDIFEHWCSDGLIHVVIKDELLAKKQFEKTRAGMAYT